MATARNDPRPMPGTAADSFLREEEELLKVVHSAAYLGARLSSRPKRIMDLVLGTLILIITAPFMLLIAIAIKLESPGPVFYDHLRIGQGGRPFTCYKFRTMQHGTDTEVHRRYVQSFIRGAVDHGAGSDDDRAPVFKLVADTRVTRAGRLLRQTSIDELPQIFNVLKGEMSLVGPRPPLPYEVSEYEDWHLERLAALPGITGLWQVQGRSRVPFDEMVRMDIAYITKQSLWLDLKILILTIPAVISGKGAM